MKTAICSFLFLLSAQGSVMANELDKFLADTKEVIGKHYEGSYGFDFNGEDKKEKLSIGSQVVAWRFLAIQPILSYAPNAADSKVSVELSFPLRLPRIPIGGDRDVKDLFPDSTVGGWVDKLGGGFWGKVNLTEGGWRFGWRMAFGNGR